jgi:hypothetical protein
MNFVYAAISLIFASSFVFFFFKTIVSIVAVIFFLAILVFIFLLISLFVAEAYPKKAIQFIKLSYLVICCSILYYLFLYPGLKNNNVGNYIGRYIYCEVEIINTSSKVNRTIELPRNKNCGYIQEPSIIIISDILKPVAIIEVLYLLFFFSLTTFFWFLRKLYMRFFCYLGSLLNHFKKLRKKNNE